MKQISLFIALCTAVLLLSACSGRSNTASISAQGDTIPLRYSENLSIIDNGDYTLAQLRNPWDTAKVLHTYILVDKNQPLPSVKQSHNLLLRALQPVEESQCIEQYNRCLRPEIH